MYLNHINSHRYYYFLNEIFYVSKMQTDYWKLCCINNIHTLKVKTNNNKKKTRDKKKNEQSISKSIKNLKNIKISK